MPENLLTESADSLKKLVEETTAQAPNVLSGKTFILPTGELGTGTMTNRGTWNSTVSAGSKVTIPQGYHSGSGAVTASSYKITRKTLKSNVNGSGTISCTSIPNYKNLTNNNFAFANVRGYASGGGYSCSAGGSCSLSYTASTGKLTYNVPSYQGSFTSGVDGNRTVYGNMNADIIVIY